MDAETRTTFLRITEAMKKSSDPAMRTIGGAVNQDLKRKQQVQVQKSK